MKLAATTYKFSGPPGTGKSTTLLTIVQDLLSRGIDPEDITYTTFTRAGAYEARDRACKKFNLPQQRFPYFRTLHSLCYQFCEPVPVMTGSDWCTVARRLGMSFTLSFNPEEMIPRGHTKGDYLMSLWALARTTRSSLQAAFASRDMFLTGQPELTLSEVEHFAATVTAYKSSTGKIDFTDMLERYLEVNDRPWPSRYIIVDESQDLSALQWACIRKMAETATAVWVAGDDDQCIHEWNGASPQTFIGLEATEYKVLPQSYRIPAKVHGLAGKIIRQVRERLAKVYDPRKEEGKLEYIADLTQVDLTRGSWLLLARNLIFLDQYINRCRELGLMFHGQVQQGLNPKTMEAITTWMKLGRNQSITHQEALGLYKYLGQRDRVTRGCKKLLESEKDRTMFTHTELVKDYGLLAPLDLHWASALNLIPPDELDYLLAIEKHEGFGAKPRIEISTIHGAKGKEADNVLLMLDMTYKTHDAYLRAPEAEHRVWYVGVTRARDALFIMQPQTEKHYVL